jgi:hypothetical protein
MRKCYCCSARHANSSGGISGRDAARRTCTHMHPPPITSSPLSYAPLISIARFMTVDNVWYYVRHHVFSCRDGARPCLLRNQGWMRLGDFWKFEIRLRLVPLQRDSGMNLYRQIMVAWQFCGERSRGRAHLYYVAEADTRPMGSRLSIHFAHNAPL